MEREESEFRAAWRGHWLDSIRDFSDYEEQKRRWLDFDEPSPHFQLDEYMCCYFDDLGLYQGYQPALSKGLVTEAEVAAVAEFHALAQAYIPLIYESARILEDPHWLNVVSNARAARRALLGILQDSSELDHLCPANCTPRP